MRFEKRVYFYLPIQFCKLPPLLSISQTCWLSFAVLQRISSRFVSQLKGGEERSHVSSACRITFYSTWRGLRVVHNCQVLWRKLGKVSLSCCHGDKVKGWFGVAPVSRCALLRGRCVALTHQISGFDKNFLTFLFIENIFRNVWLMQSLWCWTKKKNWIVWVFIIFCHFYWHSFQQGTSSCSLFHPPKDFDAQVGGLSTLTSCLPGSEWLI